MPPSAGIEMELWSKKGKCIFVVTEESLQDNKIQGTLTTLKEKTFADRNFRILAELQNFYISWT